VLAVSGMAAAVLLWLGAPALAAWQNNPSIEHNLSVFGIYGAFIIASSFVDPVFIFYKRVRYLFMLSAAHGLFFIILTVYQYFAGGTIAMLFVLMGFFGAGKFVLAVLFLVKIRHETGTLSFFGLKHSLGLQLSFALPVALTNSVDIISRWLDKLVISFVLGTEPLGVFYVGAIEIPFVGVLVSTVYNVISPHLNSYHHEGKTADFTRLVTQTLSFTAKFIWPLGVYLLLLPIRIFLFGVIILALGHPRMVLLAALGALGLNCALNVVLIMTIGFLGPAIATVVSTYLQAAALLWFILGKLRVGLRDLIPVGKLSDIMFSCGVAAVAAYLCNFQNNYRHHVAWRYSKNVKKFIFITNFINSIFINRQFYTNYSTL